VNKLATLGIRTKVQEVVHDAVAARTLPERMATVPLKATAR
jgi:hypothetical protein